MNIYDKKYRAISTTKLVKELQNAGVIDPSVVYEPQALEIVEENGVKYVKIPIIRYKNRYL